MSKSKIILIIVAVLVLIQLVPYGKNHDNPQVIKEPKWDSPKTRELFFRSCGDCHSNETKWPWYSNVAPISWLVSRDVFEGREHFNVSEWGRKAKNEGDEAYEEVKDGDMPMKIYLIAHPEARLSDSEKEDLLKGLKATFGVKEDTEH